MPHTLDERELKGVIAHEISHIKNKDTLISTIAVILAGSIAYVAVMARWAFIFGGSNEERGNFYEIFANFQLTFIKIVIILALVL